MRRIFVLLGGIWGWDGYGTSLGLLTFSKTLATMPDTTVQTFTWNNYTEVAAYLWKKNPKDVNVVVGYSGGGSRTTWLANQYQSLTIDLAVLWDPSPKWQMEPVCDNLKFVVQFYNLNPMMPSFFGMLGGGLVTLNPANKTTKVITETVSMQHLLIQTSSDIKNKTWNYIQQYG